MLEITNLCAGYGRQTVLRELNLTIPEGQVTVIAGPNGCGKSTLLKALAGILPASGRVTLDGEDLTGLPQKALARKIAYLPQHRQVPEITAMGLVLHGRFPYLSYPRRYREEDRRIARESLEQMGVPDLEERKLPALSGGQRQKVYIAMALAQSTPVVLLDEPTTYLDIAHQLQTLEHARKLAAQGKTVVLVLHDLAMALEYADNLAVLSGSGLAAWGTPEAVFQSGVLDRVFGVHVRRTETAEGWKYYYSGGMGNAECKMQDAT